MGIMCEDLPKKNNHSYLKKSVCKAVDSYEDGDIVTPEMIKTKVIAIYPNAKNLYLDTIMRYVRKYRRENILCIDRQKSLYVKRCIV